MEIQEENRIYSQMSKQESEAFSVLFKKASIGLIQTSKESLLRYFDKMHKRGWKNSKGETIYNIVGYVTCSFNIYTRQANESEELLSEMGLSYEGMPFRDRY